MVEPIVDISEEEMKANGVLIVLKFLCDRPRKDAQKMSAFDKATKKALLKIKREYALITMSVLSDDDIKELETIPLHAGHGWSFETRVEEIYRTQLPISNERFLEIIGEAFEIAT